MTKFSLLTHGLDLGLDLKKGQIFWNFLNLNFHSKNLIDFENRLPFLGPFFLEFINFQPGGATDIFFRKIILIIETWQPSCTQVATTIAVEKLWKRMVMVLQWRLFRQRLLWWWQVVPRVHPILLMRKMTSCLPSVVIWKARNYGQSFTSWVRKWSSPKLEGN